MPTSKSDYKLDIQAIKTGNSVGTFNVTEGKL